MKEIKILGAGISGLTAAINLAKAGYKVKVYEKNKDVGMRFHGDLEGLENWSEREYVVKQIKGMDIKINFDCDPFTKLIISDGEKEKKVSFKEPIFYLVKRGASPGTFDYGLKKQALEAGVKIEFNKTISPEKADIVATGPIIKDIWGADKGIVFRTKSKDKVVLVFNDSMAYKGYSYLLITKKYGCMCVVVENKPGNKEDGKKLIQGFIKAKRFFGKKFHIHESSIQQCGGIGSFVPNRMMEVNHKKKETLFVGEAAGLQDCFMGFGMRYAFESGYLAAYSIINKVDYEELAKRRFQNKMKAAIVDRYVYEKVGGRFYHFVVRHLHFAKIILYIFYRYTLFQRLLYPFAYHYMKKGYKWI